MKRSNLARLVSPFVLATFFAIPSARAVDLSFKLEPGVAAPLSSPQSDRFGLGGAVALKGMLGLGAYLDATLGVGFLALSTAADSPSTETGTAWAGTAGLRFKPRESEASLAARPREPQPLFGIKPWIDADAMFVRTGSLSRFGFAAAAGLSVPIGAEDQFWIGPFVRYMQIVGRDRDGFDTRDSRTIIVGLSLETGASLLRRNRQEEVVVAESPPPVAAPPPAVGDRDGDGVLDDVDRCPDVPGPASNGGCPVTEKVIVKPDKLELTEKIQFAWNSPVIERSSRPALDAVAKSLNDNKGYRVQVEGHASSEGGDEHNQRLSERRARGVVDYLVRRGISRDRLKSVGFSSSRPVSSNDTEAGRVANRRVEFVVTFIIVNEGSAQ